MTESMSLKTVDAVHGAPPSAASLRAPTVDHLGAETFCAPVTDPPLVGS